MSIYTDPPDQVIMCDHCGTWTPILPDPDGKHETWWQLPVRHSGWVD